MIILDQWSYTFSGDEIPLQNGYFLLLAKETKMYGCIAIKWTKLYLYRN